MISSTLPAELVEYLWRVLQLTRKQISTCFSRWSFEQLEKRLIQNPKSFISELNPKSPVLKLNLPSFNRQSKAPENYLTSYHDFFPERLRHLEDMPWVLYYRGSLELLKHSGPYLTVVGTRSPSSYARKACESLLEKLAPWDPLILSGMAAGLDGVAHRSALKLGLKTIGVIGTPLHRPYPSCHQKLFYEMEEQGLLLTEVYPRAPMGPWRFPERNRLLAALGQVTLVVEAPEKSGALLTANMAADLGREVFVVPGPLFPNLNRGGHLLVQQGAQLLSQAEEIIEFLLGSPKKPMLSSDSKRFPAVTGDLKENLNISKTYNGPSEGKVLLELLSESPMQIDKIIHISQKSASEVSALLMELNLEGWIEELPGAYFQLRSA